MSTRGLCFNYSVVNLASKSKCKLYKKKKRRNEIDVSIHNIEIRATPRIHVN